MTVAYEEVVRYRPRIKRGSRALTKYAELALDGP